MAVRIIRTQPAASRCREGFSVLGAWYHWLRILDRKHGAALPVAQRRHVPPADPTFCPRYLKAARNIRVHLWLKSLPGETAPGPKPLLAALDAFASLANSVINLVNGFDEGCAPRREDFIPHPQVVLCQVSTLGKVVDQSECRLPTLSGPSPPLVPGPILAVDGRAAFWQQRAESGLSSVTRMEHNRPEPE